MENHLLIRRSFYHSSDMRTSVSIVLYTSPSDTLPFIYPAARIDRLS